MKRPQILSFVFLVFIGLISIGCGGPQTIYYSGLIPSVAASTDYFVADGIVGTDDSIAMIVPTNMELKSVAVDYSDGTFTGILFNAFLNDAELYSTSTGFTADITQDPGFEDLEAATLTEGGNYYFKFTTPASITTGGNLTYTVELEIIN